MSATPRSTYLSSVWKDNIFANKTLFATGGAGTIVSAQVRALVRLGANACVVGRNTSKTVDAAAEIAKVRPGAKVIGIGGVDVRKYEDLKGAVERCVAEVGGVDFCIAGAAGNFLAPQDQLSPNAFKSVMDIDVLGSYNTLKAVLPHLVASAERNPCDGVSGMFIPRYVIFNPKESDTTVGVDTPPKKASTSTGGRILFVSATLHYAGTPLQTHVSAAKAAVDALSASVAIEQGPKGVRSNVVAPGPIANTEGMSRLASSGSSPAKSIPLGRLGTVREIADATVYLFAASGDYVNGAVLVVDGGAWRIGSGDMGGFRYPDFLLSGDKMPYSPVTLDVSLAHAAI